MIALLDALLAQTPAADVSGPAQINLLQAIVLGIVQGLTEFLPISSSAHLKVVPIALGWGDAGVAYTAVIQLGSIVAVLWYFWQDLTTITFGAVNAVVRRDYESQEFRTALGIALGTIPVVFFGLLIKILVPDFDKSPLRSLGAIAIASIVMSLLLAIAEKIGKRNRTYEKLTVQDGIFMGLERPAAARFSFLLGIPAITLAGLVELKGALGEGIGDAGVAALIVGTISAFVFSYLSIAWLMKFLQTQNTWLFVWYRLAFGVAILTALAGGAVNNI